MLPDYGGGGHDSVVVDVDDLIIHIWDILVLHWGLGRLQRLGLPHLNDLRGDDLLVLDYVSFRHQVGVVIEKSNSMDKFVFL